MKLTLVSPTLLLLISECKSSKKFELLALRVLITTTYLFSKMNCGHARTNMKCGMRDFVGIDREVGIQEKRNIAQRKTK